MDALRHHEIIDFDKCQFLFITPIEWQGERYHDFIRKLFLEAKWITLGDHRSRLVLLPFLDCYVSYLGKTSEASYRQDFIRERKYLLCSMVPDIETDGIIFGISCFQMQNAKELSTVSNKLTTEELLLSPTVLHTEMIRLPSLKGLIKGIILKNAKGKLDMTDPVDQKKKLLISTKTITQKLHHVRDTFSLKAKEMIGVNSEGFTSLVAEEIAKRLFDIYMLVYREKKGDVPLTKIIQNGRHDLDESKLKSCLEGINCGSLVAEICSNPKIRLFLTNTCHSVKKVLSAFNPVKNSPDGIHSVVTFDSAAFTKNEGEHLLYKHLLHTTFVSEKVAEIRNYYRPYIMFGNQISEGAMQKPFTMIRIVNSLLPPAILQLREELDIDDSSHDSINQRRIKKAPVKDEIDLFLPNSFHIHAQVKDDYIKFILNKVVEVSLSDGVSIKSTFTTKEKEIRMESTVNSVCNHILSRSQMSEFQEDKESLLQQCSQHQTENGLSKASYYYFFNSLKQLIETWMFEESPPLQDRLYMYRLTQIKSNSCGCILQVSPHTVLEIGLKPVIKHVATMIATSLADNGFFGQYNISSLIITGLCDKNELLYFYHCKAILREAVYASLQRHIKRLVVFFNLQELKACRFIGTWEGDFEQILEKGRYVQIQSTGIIIKLTLHDKQDCNRIYEYKEGSCEMPSRVTKEFETYYFLASNQCDIVNQSGLSKKFFVRGCAIKDMRIHAVDSFLDLSKLVCGNYVGSASINSTVNFSFPITLNIIPESNTSTVKFELSWIDSSYDEKTKEAFQMHDRLTLKKSDLSTEKYERRKHRFVVV
ncbi:hypothetical protein BD408DRAFT_410858 [Parasitella parasitica]|nr:hypothetical protein BD408DRAFT_410858 [Parasitella parasitica]